MLKNYLKIAIRTLWKNKKLSFINVFGLAVGMSCSLLIFLFVQDELAYDKHHQDAAHIYRVVKDFINDDGSRIPDATTPGPLASAMQREIPEVVSITRVHPNWGGSTLMQVGDNRISEEKVWRVDSSFFDVFTVKFLKGDPATALKDINSIILTESAAARHFGKEDPIGKTMRMNNRDDVTVTAIIEDVPAQSHLHYDFLLSYRRLNYAAANTNWNSYNYYTYVKVTPATNIADFEKKIQAVHDKNIDQSYSAFYVQPLLDIHLNSRLKWELEPNGDRMYVYIFMIIGVFILLIAGINYINLSTAKSSLRAKETGIRKVSGAERGSLVFQFLLESVILSVVAAIIAFAIAYALLPFINDVLQKQLSIGFNSTIVLYLMLVTLLIGVIAGIFPALYLSSFKPVAVLKGFKLNERGALNLRKSLVVVQFSISIVLIISALIIIRQIDFIQSAKLGFDKEHVVVIRNTGLLSSADRSAYLNTIRGLSGVQKVAASGTILGQGFNTTRLRAVGAEQDQQLNFTAVDYNYLDVVGIEMAEGRSFSEEFPADTLNNGIAGGPLMQRLGAIIINEQAVREFNLEFPAVGKQLVWATDADTTYYVEIVGVTKDFHFTSMRNEIKPYGFLLNLRNQGNITVKLSAGQIPGTLSALESIWKESFPETPFQYMFLDESFSRMYAAETRFQKLFITLVVLGIIIACLGLFALATFSAEQRIKEIGIRKVLGASVTQVVTLLSTDFLKLVAISFVIAIPVSVYAMNTWLEGFAYRISMQWWIFVIAAVIAFAIAFLTISSQAIKAAMTNPAKSLRSE
ncbi:MAG TPA: ABC transporter permease [Chryseosolibacter sp.]|nr:ABC transporter permease [Chryseosolibacter sp.]